MTELQTTNQSEVSVITAKEQQKIDFLKPDKTVTVRGNNGKFARRLVYSPLNTLTMPTDRAELIRLTNILNGSDDTLVATAKDNVGVTFFLQDVIFKPYESINEMTGEVEHGVVTYLFAEGEPKPYVTSSKSVYIALKNFFAVFGIPNSPDYLGLTVTIVKKKGRDHEYIDLAVQ